MVRETRAQKKKREAQKVHEEEQHGQQGHQPEGQQRSQRMKRQQGSRLENQRRSQRGSSNRRPSPDFPGPVEAKVRKNSSIRWQDTVLPRFAAPYWRITAGVPILVLNLLSPADHADVTDGNDDDEAEEIETDSQSDHSIPYTDEDEEQGQKGQQGQQGQRDPPQDAPSPPSPPQQPPVQQFPPQQLPTTQLPLQQHPPQLPLKRRPKPPTPPYPGWGQTTDNTVDVDVLPEVPPETMFAEYPKDDSGTDVKDKILRIEGNPSEDDINQFGERLAKFIRSPYNDADDASAWHGVKPLGRGGFGMAGLWEKRNADGVVLDQVVVKQVGKEPGQPWDASKPMEAWLMQKLSYLPVLTGSVEWIAYKRYPRRQVHRIYMEYCAHGDLHKLIREYRDKRYAPSAKLTLDWGMEFTQTRRRFIPAAFIWDVCYQLAIACKALEIVSDEGECVHRDIKPANVFLGDYGEWFDGDMASYPTAKLGDFGIAVLTGPSDPRNPRNYRGDGTPGYRALEQEDLKATDPQVTRGIPNRTAALARFNYYRRHESKRRALPRILSHTNVWGVGAVIFELMTLKQVKHYLYNPAYNLGPNSLEALPTDRKFHIYADMTRNYPEKMIETMMACLRPNPAKRPSAEELVEVTRRYRDKIWGHLKGLGDDGISDGVKMPFGDFENMAEGNWVESPGQDDRWYRKGSTFMETRGAAE
ncbi:MAG: hypothetical protein LQ338_007735, partial [Usnochroma carphineum]